MKKLYKHQQRIIDEDRPVAGLFLGTGSGKSLIALTLAKGRTLVICPKTQREDRNWEREAKENDMDIDLTVISKETFRRDWASLPQFETVIVDEAHTCLGVTPNTRQRRRVEVPRASQLYDALDMYLRANPPKRLYLATATILRSPMTVWGASQLLGFDWNFYEFRQAFYTRLPMPGREAWVSKTDTATKERLAQAVHKLGYVGRLEDYFDVPSQTHRTVHLTLSEKQKQRIKDMRIEYPEPIARVGKIHEIENGVLNGDEFTPPEHFDSTKIDAILDLALEFPRMVVFARYTLQIEAIEQALTDKGYTVFKLTGATKDRGELFERAKQAQEGIFLAQASISSGWELPEYPTMVFASTTYSVVDRIQSEGRILRANALKKNLYIDLVVKGGVDDAVYKCIVEKKDFNERLYTKQVVE